MNERQVVDEIIADEKLWSNGSIMLFHVTPEENLESIMIEGIRPDMSRGKLVASWYVRKHGITWAMAHISLKHDLAVSKLIVMTCMLPMLAVKKSGIPYAFYTKLRFTPEYWTPADYFLYPHGGENE